MRFDMFIPICSYKHGFIGRDLLHIEFFNCRLSIHLQKDITEARYKYFGLSDKSYFKPKHGFIFNVISG